MCKQGVSLCCAYHLWASPGLEDQILEVSICVRRYVGMPEIVEPYIIDAYPLNHLLESVGNGTGQQRLPICPKKQWLESRNITQYLGVDRGTGFLVRTPRQPDIL